MSTCTICKIETGTHWVTTSDRHYGHTHKQFDVHQCSVCKLLYLEPMITVAQLHSMYSEESYYSYSPIDSKKTLLSKIKLWINHSIRRIKGDDWFLTEGNGRTVLDLGQMNHNYV